MSISATTVWEVRTTGNANNGGGYTSGGTDYSQQDSAQLNPTDLAMVTGGTTLTSATGGFTSEMVGNIIKITAGTNFTVGYYEITAYTDTNTVTLDRDATDGSNGSSGTGYVGGATDHPNTIASAVVSANVVWVAGGTYQRQGANNHVLKWLANAVKWVGYNSTRGDCSMSTTGRPILDAADTVSYVVDSSSLDSNVMINFVFQDSTSYIWGSSYNTSDCFFINCKFLNGTYAGTSVEDTWFIFCEITGQSSGSFNSAYYSYQRLLYSYIHDLSGGGAANDNDLAFILNCVVDSAAGTGADCDSGPTMVFNSVFYGNGGDGINMQSGTRCVMFNNIFVNNTGYGVDFPSGMMPAYFNYNAFEDNSSGTFRNYTQTADEADDVTSNVDMAAPASGNFDLQETSDCLDAGVNIVTNGMLSWSS